MCGIAGVLNMASHRPVDESDLRQMLAMLRHRGPDEFGIYTHKQVGLGSARLSIIDLSGGQQPISNEDGTMWIVFNGEIFNYVELRPELEARGHRFATSSDTEVLLHAYEEFGPECLQRLNGQFAFAVWNSADDSLFLARDRLGVRPLFYTLCNGDLVFGSEIKALLAEGRVRAQVDPAALGEVFTFWSPLSPHSVFRNVFELPPGHFMLARRGQTKVQKYWELDFPEGANPTRKSPAEYLEEFTDLLVDAARIRLRADVPVGAYLSGGLDSSIIASIIRNFTRNRLDTFSIAFSDPQFDESAFQERMARHLGTAHHVVFATHADIARVFPQVILHTEAPLTRTAPAPMYLLSKLVRESGFKVVLTGEGADEFLAGYDIFKEAKLRRLWARWPGLAEKLFQRIYPDIPDLAGNPAPLLAAFFSDGPGPVDAPEFSHAVRWRNNRRACRFFSQELLELSRRPIEELLREQLHPRSEHWDFLARAQYLEIKTFLSQYLLSAQGDRVAMANSVEGRFPFLDFRLVQFCNQLPSPLKLRGLTEKYLLKQLGRKWLPPEIWQRHKRPYRAPIHRSFLDKNAPDYVRDLLSPQKLRETGFFNPAAVGRLVQRAGDGRPLGETDDMALVGILSTQLLHHSFISHFQKAPPLSGRDRVKVRAERDLALA